MSFQLHVIHPVFNPYIITRTTSKRFISSHVISCFNAGLDPSIVTGCQSDFTVQCWQLLHTNADVETRTDTNDRLIYVFDVFVCLCWVGILVTCTVWNTTLSISWRYCSLSCKNFRLRSSYVKKWQSYSCFQSTLDSNIKVILIGYC